MWPVIAAIVVSFVMSYLLQPKPKTRGPDGLDKIDVPTAEVGRPIPVLFGTRTISSANIVWYGDLRTKAIKK